MENQIAKWSVDLRAGFVEHTSGLKITFAALHEAGHYQGTPRNIPPDMNAGTLSWLIRQGFAEFKAAISQESADRIILVLKMH